MGKEQNIVIGVVGNTRAMELNNTDEICQDGSKHDPSRKRDSYGCDVFGIATSGVVLSILLGASDADYRLVVIADCCADLDMRNLPQRSVSSYDGREYSEQSSNLHKGILTGIPECPTLKKQPM